MTPSLGLTNLLQWLTELRERFHLLDYWLIMKGCTQGQSDGGDALGKVWGRDMGLPGLL